MKLLVSAMFLAKIDTVARKRPRWHKVLALAAYPPKAFKPTRKASTRRTTRLRFNQKVPRRTRKSPNKQWWWRCSKRCNRCRLYLLCKLKRMLQNPCPRLPLLFQDSSLWTLINQQVKSKANPKKLVLHRKRSSGMIAWCPRKWRMATAVILSSRSLLQTS